ncbi:hypothetical protein BOTBODRAFT_37148 [Botryobasidium botryosum FD-172 SS1]|uniref:Amino acid transporter transmembrane domain-containing protein n=1 Tax=Botryobasidium botryosum (strain FD-172 SS1) TaxID=930990 RepID=A0A067M3F3_BOTB1|nr:hypothetical protein BOTBODRAFT_37148 [Botryobasidium botryosum FD-172 SS1]
MTPQAIPTKRDSGVVDSIRSYARSQTFRYGSNMETIRQGVDVDRDDTEDRDATAVDEEDFYPDDSRHARDYDDDIGDWDPPNPTYDTVTESTATLRPPRTDPPALGSAVTPASLLTPPESETAPLLKRAPSVTFYTPDAVRQPLTPTSPAPTRTRRYSGLSQVSRRSGPPIVSIQPRVRGTSTFGQTLFNSIAILLGVGLLSEPLAYSYAGWIGGTLLLSFYGWLCCYTAKILARVILADPHMQTYADIARKAFGRRATPFTSMLFCLELFALSVVLIVLFSDSLHAVLPQYSSDTYKILALVILIPTTFMPLSTLSFASVLGILSTFLIVVVLLADGVSKFEGPGSLWDPQPTDLVTYNPTKIGLSFGLFLAGFGGHAVIPSLARDMVDPGQFDIMINYAFAFSTFVYALMGAAGYLMFGRSVHEEVSQDMLSTPGYNELLNKFAVWMLVITPLTKFALSTRPLNITIEVFFGIDVVSQHHKGDHAPTSKSDPHSPSHPSSADIEDQTSRIAKEYAVRTTDRRCVVLRGIERVGVTALVVLTAITFPSFELVMSFLGAFSAFVICVIIPLSAKIRIEGTYGWYRVLDYSLIAISVGMAAWGTYCGLWESLMG